jgi:flagellar operon protein
MSGAPTPDFPLRPTGAPGVPAAAPNRPGGAGARPGAPAGANGAEAPSFAQVLQNVSGQGRTGDLRFSRHALERVARRGIPLDPSTLSRLQEGVGRAAGKGSRDSVVLVDGTAFVVSVSNKTVLTAVNQEQMREQVFTNIDSAVIA